MQQSHRLTAVLSTYKIVLVYPSALLKVMQGCSGVCLQALELFAVWQELWGERQLCRLSMAACFAWNWLPETQVGQGWCSAPVTGKRMLCLKGDQPSASAEGRNETDCV